MLFLILFCLNAYSQKIEQISDSTFLIDRSYAEFVAQSLDSLDYLGNLARACDSSLYDCISFKESCERGRELCESQNIELSSKNSALEFIVDRKDEQIQILEESIEFKDNFIKGQNKKLNLNKGLKIGGFTTTGLAILYIIFTAIK